MIHKAVLSVTQSESGSGSGPSVSGTSYRAGSVASSIDQVLGIGTDTDIPLSFTTANLQSVVMLATKDCTVEINSGTSPDVTISLKAGSPLYWQADDGYFANPFTGATTVSHLFVTTTASTRLSVLVISN